MLVRNWGMFVEDLISPSDVSGAPSHQSGANGNCFRPSLWLESLWINQRVSAHYSIFFWQKVRRYPSTWVINTSKVWSKWSTWACWWLPPQGQGWVYVILLLLCPSSHLKGMDFFVFGVFEDHMPTQVNPGNSESVPRYDQNRDLSKESGDMMEDNQLRVP